MFLQLEALRRYLLATLLALNSGMRRDLWVFKVVHDTSGHVPCRFIEELGES